MILAIIPARSGSKGIKDKNIMPINGIPLLAYSIKHALASKKIDRVIVSTDSEKYAAVAKEYGAEVPFLRPAAISGDSSTDLQAFQHALLWMKENEGIIPDICVHLRPTYPIRKPVDIDNMIQMLQDNALADSARAVTKSLETPFKMWFFQDEKYIRPVIEDGKDSFNMPRQSLPQAYLQTASIDVVYSKVIMEQHSMSGKNILGYEMEHIFDIDTIEDFHAAQEFILANREVYAY